MHAELFDDFLEAFKAGNAAADDAEIGRHADAAQERLTQLVETPAPDLGAVAYIIAGQAVMWNGGRVEGAMGAVYRSACEALGSDPLAELR